MSEIFPGVPFAISTEIQVCPSRDVNQPVFIQMVNVHRRDSVFWGVRISKEEALNLARSLVEVCERLTNETN